MVLQAQRLIAFLANGQTTSEAAFAFAKYTSCIDPGFVLWILREAPFSSGLQHSSFSNLYSRASLRFEACLLQFLQLLSSRVDGFVRASYRLLCSTAQHVYNVLRHPAKTRYRLLSVPSAHNLFPQSPRTWHKQEARCCLLPQPVLH